MAFCQPGTNLPVASPLKSDKMERTPGVARQIIAKVLGCIQHGPVAPLVLGSAKPRVRLRTRELVYEVLVRRYVTWLYELPPR
eukprot:3709117-Pyramimonas_sp.AAC.1